MTGDRTQVKCNLKVTEEEDENKRRAGAYPPYLRARPLCLRAQLGPVPSN